MTTKMPHSNTITQNKIQLYAAVLAGGISSRMGSDKRFLEINGEPLINRAMRLACSAIGDNKNRVFLCGKVPGYSCFSDEIAGLGPVGGLASGVRQVPTTIASPSPWLLVMPVDMPLLTTQLLALLTDAVTEAVSAQVRAISFQGYELPFVLKCDSTARAAIDQVCQNSNSSQRSIRTLLEQLGVSRIQINECSQKKMLNANSPWDWAEVCKGTLS